MQKLHFLTKKKNISKKYADICLDYSTTIFCVQGETIDKIIFDPKKLNINLLYVAMSRAMNINNIYLKNLISYTSIYKPKKEYYDYDDDCHDYNNESMDNNDMDDYSNDKNMGAR